MSTALGGAEDKGYGATLATVLGANYLIRFNAALSTFVEEQIVLALAPLWIGIDLVFSLVGTEEVTLTGGSVGHHYILLGTLNCATHILRQGMGIAADQSLSLTGTGAGLIVARLAGLVLQNALGAHMIPIATEHIVKVHAIFDDAAVVKVARAALGGMAPDALLYGLIEVRGVWAGAIDRCLLVHAIVIAKAGLRVCHKKTSRIRTGNITIVGFRQRLDTLQRILVEERSWTLAGAIGALAI